MGSCVICSQHTLLVFTFWFRDMRLRDFVFLVLCCCICIFVVVVCSFRWTFWAAKLVSRCFGHARHFHVLLKLRKIGGGYIGREGWGIAHVAISVYAVWAQQTTMREFLLCSL